MAVSGDLSAAVYIADRAEQPVTPHGLLQPTRQNRKSAAARPLPMSGQSA